jgi:hypothetical protein
MLSAGDGIKVADDTDQEIGKLRRFALAVGLVLFTVAIAGVELESPATIHPLGIPLHVKRPNVLGIGLCLASIYATTRYWFYGFVVAASPIQIRRRIRLGKPLGFRIESPSEFERTVKRLVSRYYPPLRGRGAEFIPGTNDEPIQALRLPLRSRVLGQLENLDYLAPVLVNGIALATYLGSAGFAKAYAVVRHFLGY